MLQRALKFSLNGKAVVIKASASKRLLDLLREDLGLTGTKGGCGIGECGACTVILNGKAVNACLVLAGQVEGSEVKTVEYLARNGNLNDLQHAFLETGAVQCGYCTPGMLMSAAALLDQNPNPSEEQIKEAIAGNLCRCTGYKQIIDAIQGAARQRVMENERKKTLKRGKKTISTKNV